MYLHCVCNCDLCVCVTYVNCIQMTGTMLNALHILSYTILMKVLSCCCSVTGPVRLFVTTWTAECQASLSFTISWRKLCPLSQWCHSTFLFSVLPFSSCVQSFPASESSPMRWLFILGGQSTGASASASVLQWIFRVDFL